MVGAVGDEHPPSADDAELVAPHQGRRALVEPSPSRPGVAATSGTRSRSRFLASTCWSTATFLRYPKARSSPGAARMSPRVPRTR